MGKRVVIALGGNALGNNLPEQMIAVKQTARAIVDLIEEGHEVIIAHGNGPQVGMIQKAMAELTRSEPEKYIPCPLSVCVAMSQGYIGYDLQNALREELLDRGISKGVATVLTQVEVNRDDPAFQNPTKPIGAFMTKEEADKMVAERGYNVIEDAGRGYRRVVASPKPQSIIEIESIRDMVDAGLVVVACGGGLPLRDDAMAPLKSSGTVVFLCRDPGETFDTVPMDARPLAQEGREAFLARFRDREPVYRFWADQIVTDFSSPEATVNAILEGLS